MSVWHPQARVRPPQAHVHPVTLVDMAIFAAGLFVAAVVGIAASGAIPPLS